MKGTAMLESLDRFLTNLIDTVIPNSWTPNHITSVRILLIPVVWALYYVVSPWAATGMCAFLAATDFVDGRLARARNVVSASGKKLDIACDLALVWSTAALLWREQIIVIDQQSVLFWSLVFILVREALVTAIRFFFGVGADDVQVLKLGKCKTAFFMFGLVVLLTSTVWSSGQIVGTWLVEAAAACSLISGIQYFQQFSRPRQ